MDDWRPHCRHDERCIPRLFYDLPVVYTRYFIVFRIFLTSVRLLIVLKIVYCLNVPRGKQISTRVYVDTWVAAVLLNVIFVHLGKLRILSIPVDGSATKPYGAFILYTKIGRIFPTYNKYMYKKCIRPCCINNISRHVSGWVNEWNGAGIRRSLLYILNNSRVSPLSTSPIRSRLDTEHGVIEHVSTARLIVCSVPHERQIGDTLI